MGPVAGQATGVKVLAMSRFDPRPDWQKRTKAMLDWAGAAVGLCLLSPVLVAAGLAVQVAVGWPVLFFQERAGLGGRPFRLVKLRSMTEARDAQGRLLPDDQRLTRLGRFLRASSVDELPQLWNVMRGELSLVGPRPLPLAYLPRYSPEQARRHEVLPGITGLAQVSGRNALGWDEKLALDVQYVDHWSLALDFRIFLRTMGAVLGRRGISREGHATAPEFLGSLSGERGR